MAITPQLLQYMLVFVGLSYLFTRTNTFRSLLNNQPAFPQQIVIFLLFSSVCLLGNTLSIEVVSGVYANTRAIGAVLGGLFGGWRVGFLVGLVGGAGGYFFFSEDPKNNIDIAFGLGTAFQGLFAGFIRYYLFRTRSRDVLFSPFKAFLIALVAEAGNILLILSMTGFSDEGRALVKVVAIPMLLANSIGVGLIMLLVNDQKKSYERQTSTRTAWRIVNQSVGIMTTGFNEDTSTSIAHIVKNETGVGAVSITDTNKILAFTGIGESFYHTGMPIKSTETLQAIKNNAVVFTKTRGNTNHKPADELGAVLVIPLRDAEHKVFGTIKLYEPKDRLFLNINKQLGIDIAHFLSNQILAGKFELQKNLLIQEELKRIQAQINPHFLFNALNTIRAFTRTNPDKARNLLMHLSTYFRKNLNRPGDTSVTLVEELEHIDSYLKIEKARYGEALQIHINIPESMHHLQLPIFTIQPLVENAIKHGTSEMFDPGVISLYCKETIHDYLLIVQDNAGRYITKDKAALGIGLDIVNKRLKSFYGVAAELSISCEPQEWTKVTIVIPKNSAVVK